jgi:hypothetical protein
MIEVQHQFKQVRGDGACQHRPGFSRFQSRVMEASPLDLIFLAEVTLLGQDSHGDDRRDCEDPTGAVISSASITIVNKATGLSRASTTNPDGTYAAPALR